MSDEPSEKKKFSFPSYLFWLGWVVMVLGFIAREVHFIIGGASLSTICAGYFFLQSLKERE